MKFETEYQNTNKWLSFWITHEVVWLNLDLEQPLAGL